MYYQVYTRVTVLQVLHYLYLGVGVGLVCVTLCNTVGLGVGLGVGLVCVTLCNTLGLGVGLGVGLVCVTLCNTVSTL